MQWLMLQQDTPDDYVIATGQQLSVRDFVAMAANSAGIELRFEGQGLAELGIVDAVDSKIAPHLKVGDVIVRVDERYFRPAEVATLLGDASKARQQLGWQPEITVQEMCAEMVAYDLNAAKKDALLKQHGYAVPTANE
jgi:GDPmannose 4,6-dehydratase